MPPKTRTSGRSAALAKARAGKLLLGLYCSYADRLNPSGQEGISSRASALRFFCHGRGIPLPHARPKPGGTWENQGGVLRSRRRQGRRLAQQPRRHIPVAMRPCNSWRIQPLPPPVPFAKSRGWPLPTSSLPLGVCGAPKSLHVVPSFLASLFAAGAMS